MKNAMKPKCLAPYQTLTDSFSVIFLRNAEIFCIPRISLSGGKHESEMHGEKVWKKMYIPE